MQQRLFDGDLATATSKSVDIEQRKLCMSNLINTVHNNAESHRPIVIRIMQTAAGREGFLDLFTAFTIAELELGVQLLQVLLETGSSRAMLVQAGVIKFLCDAIQPVKSKTSHVLV